MLVVDVVEKKRELKGKRKRREEKEKVQRKRGEKDNKIELILFMLIILTLNTTWALKPNTITYIIPF